MNRLWFPPVLLVIGSVLGVALCAGAPRSRVPYDWAAAFERESLSVSLPTEGEIKLSEDVWSYESPWFQRLRAKHRLDMEWLLVDGHLLRITYARGAGRSGHCEGVGLYGSTHRVRGVFVQHGDCSRPPDLLLIEDPESRMDPARWGRILRVHFREIVRVCRCCQSDGPCLRRCILDTLADRIGSWLAGGAGARAPSGAHHRHPPWLPERARHTWIDEDSGLRTSDGNKKGRVGGR